MMPGQMWFYILNPDIQILYAKELKFCFSVSVFGILVSYIRLNRKKKHHNDYLHFFIIFLFLIFCSHRGTWDIFCEVQYSQEALSGSVFLNVQSEFPSRRAALRIESNSFLPIFGQCCTRRCSDTVRPGLSLQIKKKISE